MDLVHSETWESPRLAIYSEIMCVWRDKEILFLRSGITRQTARHFICYQAERIFKHDYAIINVTEFIIKFEYENMGCFLFRTRRHSDGVRFHAVLLLMQSYLGFELFSRSLMTGTLYFQPSERRILQIFEDDLLFDAFQHVNWRSSGRHTFLKRLQCFLRDDLAIEMALPAFPCKTSNHEKAASRLPDAAEYLALQHLYAFCARIGKIYRPGCYINIISDGHVFSDCIGVDDSVVDTYNAHLQAMLELVKQESQATKGGIRFYKLGDLLQGSHLETKPHKMCKLSMMALLAGTPDFQKVVNHPVRTQLDPVAEIDRALLLLIASPPAVFLQDVIKTQQEHPLTKLFRGFARFMFEDLAFHPDYSNLTGGSPKSTKMRQKVAEKVAIEMILRNQAYSRLVEMVMPGHIRLSIHAHNNAGPKFAIRTLPKHVRYATSADELVESVLRAGNQGTQDDQNARETLHVPTPWHNTLVRAGSETFICKAKLAEAAASTKGIVGKYQKDIEHGVFVLSKSNIE